jgi:uncharacterized protein
MSLEEREKIKKEDFEYWLNSANQFFTTFQDDFNRDWLSKSAFELHQSTERFITAYMLVKT